MTDQKAIERCIEGAEILVRFNKFNQYVEINTESNMVLVKSAMSLKEWKDARLMAIERTERIKSQSAEILRLREEISTLRNLARVRVADGFRGGE